jgi:hypothetical protein
MRCMTKVEIAEESTSWRQRTAVAVVVEALLCITMHKRLCIVAVQRRCHYVWALKLVLLPQCNTLPCHAWCLGLHMYWHFKCP